MKDKKYIFYWLNKDAKELHDYPGIMIASSAEDVINKVTTKYPDRIDLWLKSQYFVVAELDWE